MTNIHISKGIICHKSPLFFFFSSRSASLIYMIKVNFDGDGISKGRIWPRSRRAIRAYTALEIVAVDILTLFFFVRPRFHV